MGYSGAGLYDDDAGADVRIGLRDLVADGLSGEEATDALVRQWDDALEDHDEACAFWLALADSQFRLGRLDPRVKERALSLIASGEDLVRFEHDAKLHARRRKVLDDLTARLESAPPSPVRLRQRFRSTSPVAIGDVFSFAFPSGRLVYLRCVDVTGDNRESFPIVEVLDWPTTESAPDPAGVPARPALRRQPDRFGLVLPAPDLFGLVRFAREPDPADRIVLLARETPITRRRPNPWQLARWTELEDELKSNFGI